MFTGGLFLFGQTKRTGEANMYPKPVQDLSGKPWDMFYLSTNLTQMVFEILFLYKLSKNWWKYNFHFYY